MSARSTRFAEIDALKVAGIATVVLIHSMRAPWDPAVSPVEVWFGQVTRFGVPAFLFASGFLYATTEPVRLATIRGRLRRILLPYLVASVAAQVFRRSTGYLDGTGSVLLDLLIGASFGPYYYVFVITLLVVVTPWLAGLSGRAVGALLLCFAAAQWATEAGVFGLLDLRWHLRNPTLWWAYFLLGWWMRLHLPAVRRVLSSRFRAILSGLAVSAAALSTLCALEGRVPDLWVRTGAWLDIYAILGLVWVAASRARGVPSWLRFASDATYAVYLFHLFFVIPAERLAPAPPGAITPAALALPWIVGLAGPLVLVAVARSALGARSRTLLGA